jgi:PTH2 family peptidyl-tRNA hydrolase
MLKQVLVYRRDLQMRKGKIAAQCAHAAVTLATKGKAGRVKTWLREGQKKVVLSVEDLPALQELHDQLQAAGLPVCLITDAGHTEFHGVPTVTCLGCGPVSDEQVDQFTKTGSVETKLA